MATRFAGVGTMGQFGFFDADRRLAAISAKGDPLEMIARVVPFESFRAEIEAAVLTPRSEKKSTAGRARTPATRMASQRSSASGQNNNIARKANLFQITMYASRKTNATTPALLTHRRLQLGDLASS